MRTVYVGEQVRPHFVGTRWGVCVWPGDPRFERVDEYESREKAEQMLRDVYGDRCVLVCREVAPWLPAPLAVVAQSAPRREDQS